MKCLRVEDWYEKNGDDSSFAGLEDLLAHARSCPECATVMKNRAVILETMREMPEPQVPRDLPARIGQLIDIEGEETDNPVSAPNIIDHIIETWLRPVQYTLATACLVTILWIGLSEFPRRESARHPGGLSYASARHGVSNVQTSAGSRGESPARGQALAKLSDEDIAAFMQKLNEYRRSHPEMNDAGSAAPEGMLAADR